MTNGEDGMVEASALKCPECGSDRLFRDGQRYLSNGASAQRWLCRNCSYRFSKRHFKDDRTNCRRQLCVLQEAKKLEHATETKTVAGEESQTQQDAKGKLVWFIWEMQKQNYSRDTIAIYSRTIQALIKRKVDLSNPDSVKEALAKWGCGESHKHNIAAAYTLFLRMQGLTWEPPICHVARKLPFIPTEKELNDLIAGTGRKTSVFLQTLKETAMRSGECSKLKWENVDLQRRTIILNEAEKTAPPESSA
jgi:integrase